MAGTHDCGRAAGNARACDPQVCVCFTTPSLSLVAGIGMSVTVQLIVVLDIFEKVTRGDPPTDLFARDVS